MEQLNKQELHNLAMNIVGEDLENHGYEFLAINSKLKKNPQFVALKDKKLHFVVVRAVVYPDDPRAYDETLLRKVQKHAEKYNAETFYAGVGLANRKDLELPVSKEDDYVVNYKGVQKL